MVPELTEEVEIAQDSMNGRGLPRYARGIASRVDLTASTLSNRTFTTSFRLHILQKKVESFSLLAELLSEIRMSYANERPGPFSH